MSRDPVADLLARFPEALRGSFERGERDAFDRAVAAGELFDPGLTQALDALGALHGVAGGGSRYDLLSAVAGPRLRDRGGR